MKKTIAIILTILTVLLILDSMNAGHAFMMLFLAGVIPGTDVAINATFMLTFFAAIAGFIVARVTVAAMRAVQNRRPLQAAKA